MQSRVPKENQSLLHLDENAEFNPKMISYRPQHETDYTPYNDSDFKNDSFISKSSSGIGDMWKGLKNVMGLTSKKRDEDSVILSSASPSKLEISVRDVNAFPIQNHPIAKIDFTELSNILQNPHDSLNRLNVTKPSTNAVNVSFAGSSNTINNDFLNQSTFSFHSNSNSSSKDFC